VERCTRQCPRSSPRSVRDVPSLRPLQGVVGSCGHDRFLTSTTRSSTAPLLPSAPASRWRPPTSTFLVTLVPSCPTGGSR
jgi:hypothetical protein